MTAPGHSSEHQAQKQPRRQLVVAAAIVLAAVALTFGGAVGGPFHAYDDATFIEGNRLVVAPGKQPLVDLLLTPTVGYVVPVTVLTQATLYALGDGSPLPFHLAALLLHATLALLLLLVASRLSRSVALGAALAAAWALHPLVVEPVAWATGLKDLLMATCAVGATALLLRHLDCRSQRVWPAVALATAAALAKPTGALLGLGWLAGLWAARRWGARLERRTWTAVIVAAALGLVVATLSKLMHDIVISDPARVAGGAMPALLALGYQVAHLLWPSALHPVYLAERTAGFSDGHAIVGVVALLTLVALAVLWLRRGARTADDESGSDTRAVAVLLGACALAVYLPVSNLLAFPRFVADSYLYLPLAFAALALAAVAGGAGAAATLSGRARVAAVVVLVALALVGAWRSHAQVARWRDSVSLWGPLARQHPKDPRPWQLLAQGLEHEKRLDRASGAYMQAFARGYPASRLANLARLLMRTGKLDDAACVLAEEIARGPERARARRNLVVLLATHPRFTPAKARMRTASRWALAATLAELRASAGKRGALSWPASLTRAARTRLQTLGGALARPASLSSWPLRGCAALRRAPVPFDTWRKAPAPHR